MFISVKAGRERADERASERANEHFWPSGHLRMSGWSSASPGLVKPALLMTAALRLLWRLDSLAQHPNFFVLSRAPVLFIWFTLPYFYWFRTLKTVCVREKERERNLAWFGAYVKPCVSHIRTRGVLGLLDHEKMRGVISFKPFVSEWKKAQNYRSHPSII